MKKKSKQLKDSELSKEEVSAEKGLVRGLKVTRGFSRTRSQGSQIKRGAS